MEFPRAALCSLYVVFCSCFVDAILSLVSPRILTMMFYRVFLTLCFLFYSVSIFHGRGCPQRSCLP